MKVDVTVKLNCRILSQGNFEPLNIPLVEQPSSCRTP